MVSEVVPIWKLSHGMTKPTKWSVRPAKTRSAWASAQSDQMDGWVRVLRPFDSISVISRRWKGEHERLCAMKRRLSSGRISLPAGIEPVTPWSEVGSANRSATRTLQSLIRVSADRLKQNWVLSYPLRAQRRLWSDWADAQADLSLRWAQKSFCWFCHEVAQNASPSSLHMQHIFISSHFLLHFA